jgi:hypothetical protein
VHKVETDLPDQPGDAVAVVGHAEPRRRVVRLSAARSIPGHDVELVREPVELSSPRAAVETEAAMQEKHRLA